MIMVNRRRKPARRNFARATLCLPALLLPAFGHATAVPQPGCAGCGAPAAVGAAGAALVTEQIVVVAARRSLLGHATTASEGVVSAAELALTPAYRPGQLLETVPGLIVTAHSGEGKANQYLLRGYNLDHGTDLATFVDGMPINQPTHAHGQGFTDLNFLIPEVAGGLDYTKGPYYAAIGDFGGVGSVHLHLRDTIPNQLSVTGGTYGFARIFAAGTADLGPGHLLAAADLQHYDGPFHRPDDYRKEDAMLRYSQQPDDGKFTLTGMVYHGVGALATDIPTRAIADGLVPNRFGSLDSSDGNHSLRISLSSEYEKEIGGGTLSAGAFYIHNELRIFNNFTHFLFDPVHGDQEDQFENRNVYGGQVSYAHPVQIAGIESDITAGMQTRYDLIDVGRLPSEGQSPLPVSVALAAGDPVSFVNHDQVNLFAGGLYIQAVTHWTDQIRTVLGLRNDFQTGQDVDLLASEHATGVGVAGGYSNGGSRQQSLFQPKGSLIYAPTRNWEIYLSAGEGFHSADIRGVNQDRAAALGLPPTPLLARQVGEELGVRGQFGSNVTATASIFNLDQRSETIINPDIGQDSAGPPSRRYGFEVNATWQIKPWLELYLSYSGDHTRFTKNFDDGTGHVGTFITDAPRATGAAALYLQNLGPWSGGLEYRYLGDYPLTSLNPHTCTGRGEG